MKFCATWLDVPHQKVPLTIVSLDLDFERQIEAGDAVTSAVSVTDVDETSLVFDHELRVDGAVVVTVTVVQVAMDDDQEGAIPVLDEWRDPCRRPGPNLVQWPPGPHHPAILSDGPKPST